MRRLTALFLAASLASSGAAALAREQDAASAAAPGQAVLSHDFSGRVPPKDRPAMVEAAKAVTRLVMETPSLSTLVGVAVNGGLHGAGTPSGAPATDPYSAFGPIILRWINLPLKSKTDAQGRFEGEGEGPVIHVLINNLYLLPGNAPPVAVGETFTLPTDLQIDAGVLRFLDRGWEVLVVHRPGVLPFAHLSREELLTRAMAALPDAPGLDERSRARIAERQAVLADELRGLSPRERVAPGCDHGRIGKQYSRTGCDVPGAVYVVRYNAGYFDRRLARTTPQIISLRVRARRPGALDVLGDRLRRAFREVDLAALQALVR